MNRRSPRVTRRRVLGGVATSPFVLSGCLGTATEADCTGEWTPRISGEEPTLAPGDSTTVQIDVESARGVSLRIPLESDVIDFDVARAAVRPTPDRTADSYPPKWYWEACTGPEVVVPVSAAEDARSGEHGYVVTAVRSLEEGSEAVTREFTVMISKA